MMMLGYLLIAALFEGALVTGGVVIGALITKGR